MILVVDDHEDTCRVMERLLRSEGLSAQCVTSASQALALIPDLNPNLILLDVMMPEMSGIEMLRILRSNAGTSAIPVVLLTATNNPNDLRQARTLGVNEVIQKGRLNWNQIVSRVRNYVN